MQRVAVAARGLVTSGRGGGGAENVEICQQDLMRRRPDDAVSPRRESEREWLGAGATSANDEAGDPGAKQQQRRGLGDGGYALGLHADADRHEVAVIWRTAEPAHEASLRIFRQGRGGRAGVRP